MTVECKIGPIELDAAQLVEGDVNERPQNLEKYLSPGGRRLSHGLRDKNEGFSIYCKKYQALQISGLAGWKELEWIDSSTSLLNNDDIVHRGWGLLGKTNLLVYPGVYSDVEMEVAIASTNENETLLMDYVKGAYSQLLVGYDEDAREYLVQDTFDTFSNLIWTDPISYRVSSPVVYPSSGTLYLQGIKSSGGYGALFSRLKAILPSKFTLESGIDTSVTYTPASTSAIYLSTIITTQPIWDDFFSTSGSYSAFADAIVISVGITYSGGSKVYTAYMYQFSANGTEKSLISPFSTTAALHDIRVELNDNGNIDIYFDDVKKYSGPSGLSTVHEGLYAGYALDISDTATPSATYWMKATYMNVYIDRTFPQQVILPPYSHTSETPTSYRKTMWGDLPVFENPPGGIPFQTTPEEYDKGGPRAWSDDNEDEELRRIFNQDEVIDLGENKKIIYNNLVDVNIATVTSKLETTSKFGVYGASIASTKDKADTETGKTRSLKVFTEGSVSGEGYRLYTNGGPATVGRQYITRLRFIGDSGTVTIQLCFRNAAGSVLQNFNSSNITLDGSVHEVTVTGIAPENTGYADAFIATTGTAQDIEFNLLEEIILEGNSIPDFDYMDPETGDLVKEIREKSTQFYIENGSLKVEPTNDSVKLYYFESVITDNQHNVGASLTGISGWSSKSQQEFVRDTSIFKTAGASARLKSLYDGLQNLYVVISYSPKFAVIPGEEYSIPYAAAMVQAAGTKDLIESVHWYNSADETVSIDYSPPVKANNMEWVEFPEFKVTPPAGAVKAFYIIYGGFNRNEILWYDSSQFGRWKLMEEIPLGDEEPIRLIRIKEINRETITIQINRTYWTMRRGDPVVEIKHPNTPLGISLGTCYTHDSTTTVNPGQNQDITMESQHYCLKWDAGDNIMGDYKWYGAVKASNGKIYCIPDNAEEILIIDPTTGTATKDNMGASLSGSTKWLGGVLADNGKIYCVPANATDILIIDPATNTATRSNMGATLTGSEKWIGGVLGNDGKIYCIPYNATDILIIDPSAGTATRSAMGATLTGSEKWGGGAKLVNGLIYGIPSCANDILKIDPTAGTATRSAMGLTLSGNYKWSGGILSPQGDIYGIPNNATEILIINPGNPNATKGNLGADLSGNEKWDQAVLGNDGFIYGIPWVGTNILRINPATVSATRLTMGATLSGNEKWAGGALGNDNRIYAAPASASDILKINPTGAVATRETFNFGTCDNPQPGQDLRTLIVQTTPTTIKSNKIPATTETGIGVYDKDETPTSPSGYITLAGWFVNRGRQKIKLP